MRAARHVAAAIIRRGDDVVLVLQGARGEPFWALPGGVVEDAELVPEGLAREALEETGLEIRGLRLAYLRQIDNRRSEQLQEGRGGHGVGYLVTVWVFEVDSWDGELKARDPDGVVSEARFVPVGEAAIDSGAPLARARGRLPRRARRAGIPALRALARGRPDREHRDGAGAAVSVEDAVVTLAR